MRITYRLTVLACAAIVGGCAAPPKDAPKPLPTMASLMNDAEVAIVAGRTEEGAATLKSAVAAFPADKAPRMRLAQLQFDCHNYGEAIYHAQEVLERDPDDLKALSIAAVSGLRVSSRSLGELALKNNLTGSVRAEAQDLAKLLRANIGGDIIPQQKPKTPKIVGMKAPLAGVPPVAKPSTGDTPADWLNN